MLTLILLVVLGGGGALLAVTVAEKQPATSERESRRDRSPERDPARRRFAPLPTPVEGPAMRESTSQGIGTVGSPLPRRLRRGSIPVGNTAVEGRLGDLIRPSRSRRLGSLVGLVIVVVLIGVAIAAILGAVIGGAAELFGDTIQ